MTTPAKVQSPGKAEGGETEPISGAFLHRFSVLSDLLTASSWFLTPSAAAAAGEAGLSSGFWNSAVLTRLYLDGRSRMRR